MIKKLTAVILLIGLFITILPAGAKAADPVDHSKIIDVSDFQFVLGGSATELTAGGTLSAECKVKRIDGNTTDVQKCTLIVMVYEGGKLIRCQTGTADASAAAETTLALSSAITLPENTTDYTFDKDKIRIYAYIWESLPTLSIVAPILSPNILTRPATFGSTLNTLAEVSVNGSEIKLSDFTVKKDADGNPILDENGNEILIYEKELAKIPLNNPKVTAKAEDLGAGIVIEDVTSLPNTAKIKVTSQSNDIKNYEIAFTVASKSTTVANAISADTNSRTNQYSTQYSPTGPWMQTNLYNSATMDNNYNGTLKRALIQIDVTKFPDDVSLIKNATLVITGRNTYTAGHITQYCPSSFTVNAYGFLDSEFSWSESGTNAVNASASTVGPGLNDIMAKTPFDSFVVQKAESTTGSFEQKEINITNLIKTAKQNNQAKVTVILLADNSERGTKFYKDLYAQSTANRDELILQISTKEDSSEARRPKVILEYYEKEQ